MLLSFCSLISENVWLHGYVIMMCTVCVRTVHFFIKYIYFVEFEFVVFMIVVFCVLSYMENVSYILYMIRAQQPVHIIRNILRICHTVY